MIDHTFYLHNLIIIIGMINLHYRTHLLIVLVIFVNILKPCICTDLQADPLTSYLTDKNGRFIFYHGVNVVYK